ncbi:MAG TPA: amino acid adenylation domain-containing protein [Kofleriaceae bacterium]|nr:amino acid adenylation domain-containing protein [Kofleriaceae bacterium]
MKIETTGNRDVFAPPVSYSQERLWFLEQLEPGTPLYNIPYIATVKGGIHRAAFDRAVNRLVARHESLRTCFRETAGTLRQVIHGELSVEVDWEDLGRLDPRTRADRLQAICTQVTSQPFELTKAPLFRITLVTSPLETAIITTIHHIIADGWSLGVFQRELAALYEEEVGGRAAALPELRIQYADYAVWQRERLSGEGLERLKAYWSGQLEGATTILELPGDYPRPAKQTFNGDVYMFDLAPALTAQIKALSAQQGATLFMTLFAAFAVLLYRLTGHTDALVGTPIAGRKGADVESLIGLFVNTLVLRARMEPEQSFIRLLADVKAMTMDAFEHQDLPFEKLVLELNPKRDLSHSPLIQVLFTLQNIPTLEALTGGPEPAPGMSQNLDGHTGTAKFDFALFLSEVRDKLQCSIEFNTDLFSTATIGDIGACFVELLSGITRDPEASLASYPLLDAARRRLRLERSRGADRGYSEGVGCHQLFERQVQRTPDAIAISHVSHVSHVSGRVSEQMTYAELDAYANRLARHLVARGVRPGDTVGICMPRSVRQIAAVLAAVKAGAAYVPLDPDYPLERLRFIVGDVGARVLVTSVDTRVSLDAAVEIVVLERDAARIAEQRPDGLDLAFSPEMPLYIIHTSGSTGRPKGVLMPHRPIVNLIEWQARASALAPGAVTLQYASLNFDVASQEIFSTLTSGGCLQLLDENVRREGARLLELLKSQKVCRLFLPPVALEQLAEAARGKEVALEELREVIVAGDKLQVTDSVRSFFEQVPRARLVNQYGPTESHVVSAHALEGPAAAWPVHPLIGAPIDNVQLYVLDEQREPVPVMVAGELYIGGAAVALGYLERPEETAKRFIQDPFRPGGGLLYRTGDLCRYDHGGALAFIGRADQQIKLRGFRIEPGEVEVVLKRHPAIKEATVVKWRSRQGDDQLVAYLAGDESLAREKAQLRDFLADKLPAYMIPTHFVRLDRFPLTGSGKIDRLKLPEPVDVASAPDRALTYVAPRTPVEQFLAGCWRDVLHVEQVSIHDNFFELGGHSLSATQLVSRIRDEYSLELPLFRVFERPTLEGLALEVLHEQAAGEEQSRMETLLSEIESLSEDELRELLSKE